MDCENNVADTNTHSGSHAGVTGVHGGSNTGVTSNDATSNDMMCSDVTNPDVVNNADVINTNAGISEWGHRQSENEEFGVVSSE